MARNGDVPGRMLLGRNTCNVSDHYALGGGGVNAFVTSTRDALRASVLRVPPSTNPSLFNVPNIPFSPKNTPCAPIANKYASNMTVPENDPLAAAPPPTATARHEEYQYLDLVREILDQGELRRDRCVPDLSVPLHLQPLADSQPPAPAQAPTPSSPRARSSSRSTATARPSSPSSPQSASSPRPSSPSSSGSSRATPPPRPSPRRASRSGTATARASSSTTSA